MNKVEYKIHSNGYISTHIFIVSYFSLISILILINALSGFQIFSIGILKYARAPLHLIPFLIFILLFTVNNFKIYIKCNLYFVIRNSIVLFMAIVMLLSGLMNDVGYNNSERVLIMLLHLLNLTVFLPLSINYIDVNFSIYRISKLYCWFLFILCILILIYYIFVESVYNRLGYPFMPGVFAYMCVVALIASVNIIESNFLGLFFMINIFMSGSRAALALGVLVYVTNCFFTLSINRIFILIIVFISLMSAFHYFNDFSKPFLVQRDDILSGRTVIWNEAKDTIMESALLGHYRKVSFGYNADGIELSAHNSFIDLTLQYGIFFSFLAYLYWFSFVSNIIESKNIRKTSVFAWSLFFVVTIKSGITNTFWTNMGDGATYFVVVLITMIVLGVHYRATQYE